MKEIPILLIGLFVLLRCTSCYADKYSMSAQHLLKQTPTVRSVMQQPVMACVAIHQVHFSALSPFPLITQKRLSQWKRRVEGQCVNDEALLLYADFLNAQLTELGYITSYIHYPKQALLLGVLRVELVPGKLGSIVHQETGHESHSLFSAFPLQKGEVIHLHPINQGLANLHNTQLIRHQIHIISDNQNNNLNQLVIQRQAIRAFKGRLLLESKASQQLPKHRISNVVMLANPLLLNDFFFGRLDSDIGSRAEKTLKSASILYSVPYHYWLWTLYAGYQENSMNQYLQSNEAMEIRYDSRSRLLSLQAEYLLHRTRTGSTSASIGTQIQTLDIFLEQYRLETQRRFSSYLLLGLSHKRDFVQGNAVFSFSVKQDVDWFGSTRAQVTGLEQARIYLLSIDYQRIFNLMGQSMYHRHELEVQLSHSKLDPLLELNSLSGDLGIRGFTNSLGIENGGDNTFKFKNEWGWFSPWFGVELYGALDYATGSTDRANLWQENHLIGTEIGLKGRFARMDYKLFIEAPLWYPDALKVNDVNFGVKVSFDY